MTFEILIRMNHKHTVSCDISCMICHVKEDQHPFWRKAIKTTLWIEKYTAMKLDYRNVTVVEKIFQLEIKCMFLIMLSVLVCFHFKNKKPNKLFYQILLTHVIFFTILIGHVR